MPPQAGTTLNPVDAVGEVRSRWQVAAVVFLVPLVFALFSNHVWEDYYITFRASKNLAQGHGLVYQIGEHVHSFTSPIGVLLPALLSFLTHSDTATLWFFRLICCAALSGAALVLWDMLSAHGASRTTCWFVSLALIAESKVVDFTINGMETAFMVLFTAALLKCMLQRPRPRGWVLGVVIAGLMWTRPDAFVIAGAIIFSSLLFTTKSRNDLFQAIRLLFAAAVWAVMLYGPWLAWAGWYYGSPVPNTILAKSGAIRSTLGWNFIWSAPLNYMSADSVMEWLMNPSYFFMGGWSEVMVRTSAMLAVLAGFIWLFPRLPIFGRVASFALFLGGYYLQAIPPAPWYFPVWYILAAVCLVGGATCTLERMRPGSFARMIVRSALLGALIVQAASVPFVAIQVRHQQHIIEDNGRQKIGQWLAVHASPGDTVFLEPLGYIGYFSQLRMLDFPGLSAPAVVAARHEIGDGYDTLIKRLRPTWIVLRTRAVLRSGVVPKRLFNEYSYVRDWDRRDAIDAVRFLPGRGLLEFDASFVLYGRDVGGE